MNQDKHTPGPWEFGPNPKCTNMAGQLVVRPAGEFPHGEWVADVGSMYDDHREANARLIAAAPELLEALKGMLEVFGDEFGMNDSETVDAARAAIAKATGAPAA